MENSLYSDKILSQLHFKYSNFFLTVDFSKMSDLLNISFIDQIFLCWMSWIFLPVFSVWREKWSLTWMSSVHIRYPISCAFCMVKSDCGKIRAEMSDNYWLNIRYNQNSLDQNLTEYSKYMNLMGKKISCKLVFITAKCWKWSVINSHVCDKEMQQIWLQGTQLCFMQIQYVNI